MKYVPGQLANSFEGAVVRELARVKSDGYIAHNVLLPNVRDRYNPNEHDIVLLLPSVAFTIDAKEYAAGQYKLTGNASVEWRRSPPEHRSGSEAWHTLRGLPNPFYVAFQKAKVLHGLFAPR